MLPFVQEDEDIKELLSVCDGFLFTGGQDVDPGLYGEKPISDRVVPCRERDALKKKILAGAISRDKPVLGICRGIQFLNAALWQDLPTERPGRVNHHMEKPFERPAHLVHILERTPLCALLGTQVLAVNSIHHQAVRDLAEGLSVMAVSEDGLIEALYRKESRFFWGIQWHPEYLFRTDEASRKIFSAFAAACSDTGERKGEKR